MTAKRTASGNLHIDMHVIECKMGQKAEIHLEKAHEQVENGLSHLIPAFMPREAEDEIERPDARYWWLQLHRLIASKSQIENVERSEILVALERLVEGQYSISWGAAFFTIWTNINTEEIDPKLSWTFQFKDKSIQINHISIGSLAALKLCNGDKIIPITWADNCLLYESQLKIQSDTVEDSEPYFDNDVFDQDEAFSATNNKHPDNKKYEVNNSDADDEYGEVFQSEIDENVIRVPDRIFLGHSTHGKRAFFWEFGHQGLHNRHMLIFGSSGMGKTYAIQCLLNELSGKGQNSLIIDYTNGFLPNQLERLTVENLRPKQHILRKEPLPISPFKPQTQNIDGIDLPESHSTAAKRTAAIFKTVYNLGDQQFSVLFDAIMDGLGSFGNNFNLDDLLNVLESYLDGKSHARMTIQSTMSKIKPFVLDKPFSSDVGGIGWDAIFSDNEFFCHVFQLAGLDMHSWRLVTEFILWDLYAYVRSSGNKDKPKVVVLDEVQNLDHREECPLAKYLTEGRKFGLSLILATQTLSNLSTDQQSRLFQSAHKLFFKPAETEMQEYGKVLQNATGESSKTWIERLSNLKKGECYSLGPSLGEDDVLKTIASKIKVAALEDRSIHG
jgi:DNA phosphorothioation-dependent restriction protein DptH